MILNEVSVEPLSLSCSGCEKTWYVDYDVQHVEDGHGHDRDYYFYEGLLCPDRTAPGAGMCPDCGHGRVAVAITARRASPAVTATRTAGRGSRPGADRAAGRAAAPLLSRAASGAA